MKSRTVYSLLFYLILLISINAVVITNNTSQLGLKWDASPDTNVAGYSIYYGLSSSSKTNMVNVGPVLTTMVSNLTVGQTYYFAATAYAPLFAAESEFSNEVIATIPTNKPPIVVIDKTNFLVIKTQTFFFNATIRDDRLPNGSKISAFWEQITSSSGTTALIYNCTNAFTEVFLPEMGVYTFRLTGSDGSLSSSKEITIKYYDK